MVYLKTHVYRVFSFAGVLYIQFMVQVKLLPMLNISYFYVIIFCRLCAVLNMAVFCSYLISCFPGM